MGMQRILASLVSMFAVVQLANSQTYELAERTQAGDCFHAHLDVTVAGEMRVSKDGKPLSLKLSASAVEDFTERVLAIDSHGSIQKIARVHETAKATITVGTDQSSRALREDRRLLVAQQSKGQTLVYSPAGPLTREELELAGEHIDTLWLPGLLPGKAVAIGETWKVPNDVAQALCNFEGLASQDLVCKLEEVKEDKARVSLAGTANGIDLGALAKLDVTATYSFDLKTRRIVSLEWKQKDERGQGPVSPATAVESLTQLTRAPIEQPPSLSDVALISVPDGSDPPATSAQLSFQNQHKTRFDLVYAREWQIVGQMNDHIIMRLMDRGDFVAQLTITPWDAARTGEHLSPEAFREAMAKTPGWQPDEVIQEGEIPAERAHYWIYRISAPGHMDGLKVVQTCYLIAGPGGEQVALAFTMTPAQAEKIGARDLALVSGLEFPGK
jgi:hypothetical protein